MLNTFIIIINNLMGETKLPEKENVSVPMNERNGKPKDLFFIWFASNIGILGVVYGAMIVGFQLSFVQSVLAALVAAFSFVLVGYISIAGKENGITTFMLSRAAFGDKRELDSKLFGMVKSNRMALCKRCYGDINSTFFG